MSARTVRLFVFDGFADWEPALATAHINNPAYQREPGRYAVRTVGRDARPVRSMGGLAVTPDLALADLRPEECAMLILPGGTVWDEGGNADAVERAHALHSAGVPIAAICGATAGLARGGLLDDRAHTSNGREYLAATGYGGGAHYQDAPAVTDRGVITASGTAPAEFAREIFRALELYDPPLVDAWYDLFGRGAATPQG